MALTDSLPIVTPFALTTYDRAEKYVMRERSSETNSEYWLRSAINFVTGEFERTTGRDLACRTYRTAQAQTVTLTSGSSTFTASDVTKVKEFDWVVGTGIPDGTRVYDIAGSVVTLTKDATATGAQSLTFGSEPVTLTGIPQPVTRGWMGFYLGKHPLQAVHKVSWIDTDGTVTEFIAPSNTGLRFDKELGRIVLPYGFFAPGEMNLQVECTAGFMPPKSGTTRGFDGWQELERAALRAIQIVYDDWRNREGRAGSFQVGGASQNTSGFDWPADVQGVLDKFSQRW